MPVNPAGAVDGRKQPAVLGSGRRKGRPRKLLLISPCRSVVPPAKATELIHRTRKAKTGNTITNYFSPRRPDAGAVLEAAECPPLPGPASSPPDQGARRRRSCLAPAEDEPLGTSVSGPPEEAVQEAAGAARTPVSPHKIQSLECEPLQMRLESRPRRPPLSPALDLNKPKQPRQAVSAKPGRSRRPSGTAGGAGSVAAAADGHHKLTDYFPIRRSNRRTKRALEEERSCGIRRRLEQDRDEGLEVALFPGKGRGVVATRPFSRGEFVVEYAGTLVDLEEARRRERVYAQDQNTGCYMYYFCCKDHNWCIDGTPETPRLGRLVNHSRHHNNCITRSVELDGRPRLVLLARQDIAVGEEILYDYGDRSKESLQHHPWLAT